MTLKGLFTPIVTPFDASGALNLTAVDAIVEAQLEAGASGLIACGTTGEYYTLDESERQALIERVVRQVNGRVSVLAGINALNTREGELRARQARDLGCDGLMMSPPAYSLPEQHEILAHFKAVAAATALPLVLYDFPVRAGVQIEVDTVLALSEVDNIVGIKESSGDFSRLLALRDQCPSDFQLICGCDDQAADHLWWGARAWISGSANVFPAEQAAMLAAAERQDFESVRAGMAAMMPIIRDMEGGGYNQKAKLGTRVRLGIEAGDVRQPLLPLSRREVEEFQSLIAGFDKSTS
ncbi:dihydrodipicolinate synthase family protein [Gammaproteobacteria bacterium AB-CW1]|uniref:Dihydrodipicolinate synthase family protein n=1 Tax=Natronospira elongata TaxID=3110268 RepID=A0AAP6MKN5_9GAMM|nr:dihydrodipicolinate synthase family protein [Gammaproteobacteria bacterium AB-CW1]